MEFSKITYFFKFIILKFAICLFMFSTFASANEEQNLLEFIESKQRSISSDICEDLVSLNDQIYCVKLSHITLNTCGKQSDWPCMDDEGCLEIKRLIKN